MAFVINAIKWLLLTVETLYFDVVVPSKNRLSFSFRLKFNIFTPRDVQNRMYPVNTPRKHETLTQRWSNSALVQRLVFAGLWV